MQLTCDQVLLMQLTRSILEVAVGRVVNFCCQTCEDKLIVAVAKLVTNLKGETAWDQRANRNLWSWGLGMTGGENGPGGGGETAVATGTLRVTGVDE